MSGREEGRPEGRFSSGRVAVMKRGVLVNSNGEGSNVSNFGRSAGGEVSSPPRQPPSRSCVGLHGATQKATEVKPQISHNALILIGDGQKALFLRNKGTPQRLNLEVEQVLE